MGSFTGKRIVVTGGTGSFGETLVRHLLTQDVEEIRVFSRDELKQDNLRRALGDNRVTFVMGDTRDSDSMRHLFTDVNYVFHAAALKQVPTGEFFPMEVTRTNVLGSQNVIRAADAAGVASLVVLSTDKAVYPINAMGMSKALMEKTAIAEARRIGQTGMKITVTRYGNVMMSRGSVIPVFLESAIKLGSIPITDPEMTRFMMSLEESVSLVEQAMFRGNQGSIYIRKAPAASIHTLAEAVNQLTGVKASRQIIGSRHGEKLHEVLVSAEEMRMATNRGDYIEIMMDDRGLDYADFFEKGTKSSLQIPALSSQNTSQLDASSLAEKISQLREFRELGF